MDECRSLPPTAWESFSNWQQSIVAKSREADTVPPVDRAAAQQSLLAAASDSAGSLAARLRAALGVAPDLDLMVPDLNDCLTTEQLWNPQQSWERSLHNSLSAPTGAAAVTRNEASQVLFWFVCSTAWLESGGFDDPPAPSLTKRSLDAVLQADPAELDDQQRRLLDDASRQVLRRLGGIPHVRSGHNNHLLDCPTARAWWRVEIARQAADNSDDQLSLEDCYEAFLPRGCWRAWTTTAMTMAGRLSAG